MKTELNIDKKKIYPITVLDVKPVFRPRYNCQGLQLLVLVKETGERVVRTFTLPRSFRKASDCISKFLAPIASIKLNDSMIDKPNLLAKEIKDEILNKKLGVSLELSRTGHINIVGLVEIGEGV